jgi:large repetitive protein
MSLDYLFNFLNPEILIGSGLLLLATAISLPYLTTWGDCMKFAYKTLVLRIILIFSKVRSRGFFRLLAQFLIPAISSIILVSLFNNFLVKDAIKVKAGVGAVPAISGNINGAVTIGNQFNFTLSYSNLGDAEGYAPYVDLIVPTTGVDGAGLSNEDDGIIINSASYLTQALPMQSIVFPEVGAGCSPGETPVNHPYALTNSGQPVVVCGKPGDTLVVVTLPFGSFVPEQSGTVIDFTATLSAKADNNSPLSLKYRAGFRFGNDALNNFTTDPTIQSSFSNSNINPVLFAVTKTYNGPEAETATGPNFKRRYTVTADLGNGQSVTNLDLIDKLPNNLAYFQLISSSPAGASIISQPTVGQAATSPNNVLSVRFPSVTGTNSVADAQMVFEYFVPDKTASNTDVINHSTGDDAISQNDASGQALWTPIDTRDISSTITSDTTSVDHTLTNKSIALQKSFQNLTNSTNRPNDNIQYTLNFQISDYFAYQNLQIADLLSDGQSFDTTFTPTLSVVESGVTSSGNIDISNFNYSRQTGFSGANGQTTINFNISNELVTRGLDERILGGCVQNVNVSSCNTNLGAATGTLVFRAFIDEVYSDNYGSGNPNIDMGDTVSNTATISGDVLNNSTLVPTGQSENDNSGVQLTIVTGNLEKSIYALNGVVNPSSPYNIGPGDTITYRLKFNLPLTDTENFYIDDYLPLPALRANGFSTTFDTTISTAIPAAGTAKFGPSETFTTISGLVPVVTIDNSQNKIRFDYGAFQDNQNRIAVSDILLTVTANNEPFADGVNLVNQARARATNTFSTDLVANAIIPVTLLMPDIKLTKGVVATSNSASIFTPTNPSPIAFNSPGSSTCNAGNHRFSGTINSTNLATTPINSDLSNVDANDLTTFAITLENTGKSPRGAFDLKIKDNLPSGFTLPSGGINLCLTRGDGTVLAYTPVNSGDTNPFFQSGIEITDIDANNGSIDDYNATNGANIIIASYDLQLSSTTQPNTTIENTATLFNYTGSDGGSANFVPNNSVTDIATTSTSEPTLSKTLTATNQNDSTGNNALVGEILTYQATLNVPEGQINQAHLIDSLDAGLALVSIDSISASPGLSTNIAGGFNSVISNATVSNSGQTIDLNFDTLSNTNTDNSTPETIVVTYKAVVVNATNVNRGSQLNNSVQLNYNNGSSQTVAPVSANNVTVIEPEVQVVKTVSSATGDANDLLTYTLTVSHTANSNANAYNISLTDAIPGSIVYEPLSLTNFSGVAPTSLNIAGANITASFDQLNLGQTSVIRFQARPLATVFPQEVVTNSATIKYTSLPGSVLTPLSTYNPASTERTGDNANPGGVANDYTQTSSVNFTVNNVSTTKSIVTTSEAHTTNTGGTERLAVGEIIRYRLSTQIPEGQISNFRIRDNLPTGLLFLNDSTAKFGISSNTSVTSSVTSLNSCNQVGSSATITPSCAILSSQITPLTFSDGSDPTFNLGTINNTDNDANAEYIVIEFNALVTNLSTNQAFTQSTGTAVTTTRNNNYTAIRQNSLGADVNMSTSGNSAIQIAEPLIRNLTKTITQLPNDSADPLTYRLTFSNTATGNNATTGYEVRLTDTLNANLQLNTITVVTKPATTTVTDNSNISTNLLDLTFDKLAPTESVTVDITAAVLNTVSAGQIIPNTANLTYTSLPGSGTTSNPTGSTPPANIERNGSLSVAENDFTNSNSVNFNISTGSINKTNTAGNSFKIGEEQEFDLTASLPEGLNKNLRIRDNLPSGLEYVSYQVIKSAAVSGGILAQDFSTTLSTPAVSGTTQILFNFGDVTLPSDNDTTNNSFIVRVKTRVKDISTNQNNTSLTNNADLITTNVATNNDQLVSDPTPPNITVIVPILGISKIFSPNGTAPNGTTTIQLQITNTGQAPAYEVNIEDSITNSLLTNITLQTTASGFTAALNPSGGNTIVSYTGGTVLPGQTLTFTFTVTLASNLTNGQVVPNTGRIISGTTLSGSSTFERTLAPVQSSANLTVQTPDLRITKTNSTSVILPGANTAYVLSITNAGTYRADNITVTENLPLHTLFNATNSLPTVWTNTTGSKYTTSITSLNPGQTTTVTFAVLIDNPVPSEVTQIVNTATVADDGTNGTDPTPLNNTFTDTDSLDAAPDLEITKTDGVTNTVPGDTLTYTLTIKNTGNQDSLNLKVEDTLPANVTYQSSSNSGSVASGKVTWPLFNLAAGQTVTRTVTIKINDSIPSGVTQIVNTATVADDGTNGTEANTLNNTAEDIDTLTAQPDLEVTKTNSQSAVSPDQTLTYQISIKNNGNQTATNVVVNETVPQNSSYFEAGSSGWSCINTAPSGTNCQTIINSISAGGVQNLIFKIRVSASIAQGIVNFSNTITVADDGTNGTDPTPLNNTFTDTDSLDAAPDLEITKTDGVTNTVPGDTLTYTLTIKNTGNQDSLNLKVEDTLPANVTYQSSSNSGSVASGKVTWPLFNLAAGQTVTRTVTIKINDSIPSGVTQIVNTATVADDGTNGTDPTPLNNTFTDTDSLDAAPDLEITISDANVTATTSNEIIYTVDYSNIGVQDATGVTISIVVPQNTTFKTVGSSSGWSCSDGAVAGTTCTKFIGNLNTNDSGTAYFVVLVNPTIPTNINQISASTTIADDTANGPEISTINNTDSELTPLEATPDLKVTIDDNLTTVNPDETITYTLLIENIGDQEATGIELTSIIPNQTSFVSASNSGTNTLNTVTWSIPSLTAGNSTTRTLTIKLNSSIPAGVNNITVSTDVNDDLTNGADPTPANNSDSDTDILNAVPDLVITKSDGGAIATPDTEISYTLDYANNGNQTAVGVVITETIPEYTTYLAAGSSAWSCSNGAVAGTTCTLNIGTLDPGDTGTKTMVVKINPTLPSAVDEINNTVSIADNGANGADPTPANNENEEITTSDALPDLVVTKTDNGVSRQPGESLTYNIAYSNDGNQTATGVTLTEKVPTHTTYVASGSSSWNCPNGSVAGTTCTLNLNQLDPGESGNAIFNVMIVPNLQSGVIQTSNTIEINDDGINGTDPAPNDNESTELTPLVAAPNLEIIKSDNLTEIIKGQTFTYTLTVKNIGDQDAVAVEISDILPPNLTVNSISNAGVSNSNTITWPVISLGSGETVTRTINVTFDPGSTVPAGLENIINIAQVEDDGTNGSDQDGGNNTSTDTNIIKANPDLKVIITDNKNTVNVGAVTIYEIEAENIGNQNASNSILTLTIPSGLAFAPSDSTPGWSCIGAVCTFNLATLTAGAKRNVSFAAQIIDPANVDTILTPVEIADDGTSGNDPTPQNNSAQDQDNIIGLPDLEVTKTDNITTLSAGQETEYTIVVKNTGNIILTNIQTIDTFQSEFTFISATDSPSFNSTLRTITWTESQLTPGSSKTYLVRLKLASIIPSSLETALNSVVSTEDGSHGTEQTPVNNQASDINTIDAAPDLVVTEELLTTDLFPGQTIFYKINYSNIGTQNATGTKIAFKIPKNTEMIPDPNWTCTSMFAESICTFELGNLNANESGNMTIKVKIIQNIDLTNPAIINTVNIYDDQNNGAEISLANNDDDLTIALPLVNLAIIKTVNKTTAKIQDILTYTFTYRNLGPNAATNVLLEDILPADLTFIDATQNSVLVPTTSTLLSDKTTKLVFSVPDLSPGVEAKIQVNTKVNNITNSKLTNLVSIKAREVDPELANNLSKIDVDLIKTITTNKNQSAPFTLRTGGFNSANILFAITIFMLGLETVRHTLSTKPRK